MTRRQKLTTYAVVVPFAIFLAFPFYFALVTMFKTNLDLANIERGRMSITRDRLSSGSVVAAALALITPEAASRSIRLVDESEGDIGLPFLGDEHRVRQILLNLLSNAVKFTPPGGTVAVGCEHQAHEGDRAEPAGDRVCITVRDTGIGISPDQPAKLAKFRDRDHLSITLLSDPDRTAMKAYGAFGEKKLYGKVVEGVIRSTFVVDEDGRIELAQYNVKATGHVAKLRRDLGLDS